MAIGKRYGFSLIELMVVMAIIAALVAIALPRYQSSVDNARLTALKTSLRVMRESIDRFYEDKGKFPESLQELADARYLKSVPIDPLTDSAQTWILRQDLEGEIDGVADVASGARGMTPQGVAYSDL
jgi:general secretion pathway protein G